MTVRSKSYDTWWMQGTKEECHPSTINCKRAHPPNHPAEPQCAACLFLGEKEQFRQPSSNINVPYDHFYPLPLAPFGWARAVNRTCPCTLTYCSLDTISGSFDSSFDVLFNFPSQYFSAIGLCVIFRFSRNLPAGLR